MALARRRGDDGDMSGSTAPSQIDGLTPEAVAALARDLLQRLAERDRELAEQRALVERKDCEIALRDRKIEKINFELARLRGWTLSARSEAMNAEQRSLFEDTLAEDEAALLAQLERLKAEAAAAAAGLGATPPADAPRRPRRQPLPPHLRRVEHRHEPEDTTCSTPGCGAPMTRIGEDVSERLDIVPAEYFVHRHVYGKWACRCCSRSGEGRLVQEPAVPQIVDGGIAAPGLMAHILVSRFVDHLPYYRIEDIAARSGVHLPRSTLSSLAGQAGAALEPLYEAHRDFVLSCRVLHADETPVAMLDPGAGKTRTAYMWAYARSEHDAIPGVVYDFCVGRGGKYAVDFLGGGPETADGLPTARRRWQGTLLTDRYKGYDAVLDPRLHAQRTGAACLAHARRKYHELAKAGTSAVGEEALQRIAKIYLVESALRGRTDEQRLQGRQAMSVPLWAELKAWLELERSRVGEGSATAKAIAYTLNHWGALTVHLGNGAVPVDNNHLERQIKPWALGRKAWLFCGSELAGQRAAVVMSLLQSAKLSRHEPWAYLKDVLERLPLHPAARIDELLPHRWMRAIG
jgi:transposase